jgi:hypothetical protein
VQADCHIENQEDFVLQYTHSNEFGFFKSGAKQESTTWKIVISFEEDSYS